MRNKLEVTLNPIHFSVGFLSSQNNTWQDLIHQTRSLPKRYLPRTEVRHRFENIPCPEETALFKENSERFHANRVSQGTTTAILTQAPLETDLDTFWKTACKTRVVVDLTEREDFRLVNYAPEKEEDEHHLLRKIKLLKSTEIGMISIYELDINGQQVTRIRMPWTDYQGTAVEDLKQLVEILESLDTKEPLIHCTAGVGRAGTLATARAIKSGIDQKKITSYNLEDAIAALILEGRKGRGPGFVQTEVQFKLLISYAKDLLSL